MKKGSFLTENGWPICTSSSWFFVSASSARFSSVKWATETMLFSCSSQLAKHPQAFSIAMTKILFTSPPSPFLPPFSCHVSVVESFPSKRCCSFNDSSSCVFSCASCDFRSLSCFTTSLDHQCPYRDVNTKIYKMHELHCFCPLGNSAFSAAWCWMILRKKPGFKKSKVRDQTKNVRLLIAVHRSNYSGKNI